jgi:hypothetical protein
LAFLHSLFISAFSTEAETIVERESILKINLFDTTEARASFSALLIAMTCFFYFLQFALFEEFLWGEDVQ